MINCAILDDEPHALEVLTMHTTEFQGLNLVLATSNPIDILNLVAEKGIQLLFLDINMPKMTGVEIAKIIGNKCKIIFSTASPEYALDGFDIGVVDYLLKPISYARFSKSVIKVIERINDEKDSVPMVRSDKYIYVKAGVKNSVIKIELDSISFIEGLQNYIGIYHNGRKTLVYMSMKEVEAALPSEKFLRVHKSFIVALSHISKIEGNCIFLHNNPEVLHIGESYRNQLWHVIRQSTLGETRS